MSDDDISLDEKRVYGARTGATAVFVATGVGLARVEISDDLVGEFGLVHRGGVTDAAGADGRLAIATDEDVRVGTGEAFTATGFGPATAVGWADGLVAAGDGRVAQFEASDGTDDAAGEWHDCCELDDVRAIDGRTLAAGDGVHRLDGTHIGLADARDVATGGEAPLAATGDGCYYLGNGWMEAVPGDVRVVAAAPDGRAHAATPDDLFARSPAATDYGPDAWTAVDLPVGGHVADVAYGDGATYVVTVDGTVLANAGDGWRERALGLPDARRLAVPGVHG